MTSRARARRRRPRVPEVTIDRVSVAAYCYERDKYAVSVACGERVLLPAVRAADASTVIVADGFSCREQIRQQAEREALHLAEILRARRR